MNSLEHQDIINDLHIENGSRTRPPEYPQYTECEEQAEINREDEWSPVKESGAPDVRGASPEKKRASGKAVTMAQRLKQLLTFVAFIAAAAIVVPDIVPILDLGSPNVDYIYFEPDEEMIWFSIAVETMSGDKLTVTVKNDFIKEEGTLVLGDFTLETEDIDGEVYNEAQNYYESSTEDHGISMSEEYYVSQGPNPTYHMISGEVFGLKPGMTYYVSAVCGNKTLIAGYVTTGSKQSLSYSSSSSSSKY